jgi:polyvinyl alcohol dehydrogenase (cytochrome)
MVTYYPCMKRWAVLYAAIGLFCVTPVVRGEAQATDGTNVAPSAIELATRGEALFKARCASCHDPAVERAPPRERLARRFPDDITSALTTGVMQPMAAGMSRDDIHAVVIYLAGDGASEPTADPPRCSRTWFSHGFSLSGAGWNGWSIDPQNSRLQPRPGLTAAEIPRMKVKWSMAYVGGRYGQPTIAGGRVFLTSSSGRIYSLDARTGCMHWRYDAGAGVRTTALIGQFKGASPSGYLLYFGDFQRDVYALDAASGKLVWRVNVETHPRGVLTGTPALYKDVLYVPLSSWEETAGDVGAYECCTARGGLVALNARSGQILWKTYAIAQAPAPTVRNTAGTQMYGPAGAAVWSTPTIDSKRHLVYIATGDSYTDVVENGSDAVIALDLASGEVKWRNQVTENDSFLMGCFPGRPAANCPTKVGPDHDFGSSPILFRLPSGKDIILAGQKSGAAFGMDPDGKGRTIWRNKIGAGSALGGIEWGIAADRTRLYVPVTDPARVPNAKPGLFALDPATGQQLWYTPAPKVACSFSGRCANGQSAAPTVIPGVVLSTTQDGHLRAYSADDGRIFWDFDTAGQKYQTINGISNQSGGTLDVASPTVASGMMFLISGYAGAAGGTSDNVLLAFSVDGR